MAKFCTHCGKAIADGNTVCSACGTPVDVAVVNTQPTVIVNNNTEKGNGMAVAGFVISLISLILCCGTLSWLSLIFSIVGIVSAKKLLGKGKGLSIAGIILSVLGMILFFVAMFVLPILGISTIEGIESQIEDEWQNVQTYDDYDSDYGSDFDYDFDN